MLRFVLILVSICLPALWSPAVVTAESLESEVEWISRISGVSGVASEVKAKKYQRVYTLSGNPSSILESVRAGLLKRGWEVKTTGAVERGSAFVKGLVCTKNDKSLKLSVQGTGGSATMALELASGVQSKETRPENGSTGDGDTSEDRKILDGKPFVLNEDGFVGSRDLKGGDAVINSNRNRATFVGTCGNLTVNGNMNEVSVDATVRRIVLNGSKNKLTWSGKHNAAAPQIVDNGSKNSISRSK